MLSQSLPAQLSRWALALICALVFVHHCQPLRDALSQNAVEAGCHQGDSSSSDHAHHHQHPASDPHAGHHMSHH
ncbi:hypothetical protein [Ferrimonas lipolytica]|uniref:Uncharacterized protein n=1 Tax=Ferrimonas lipolytica TaxID=2724191 RepID=A0A6H1UEN4_9GAMM|nr:hypothetical protein [Ferrimonas lipolytica]QIZ77555.1 hypothetical protein HER31_12030 [Ferrimonas lipolytica]